MSGRWERMYSYSCDTTLLPHSSLFSLAITLNIVTQYSATILNIYAVNIVALFENIWED